MHRHFLLLFLFFPSIIFSQSQWQWIYNTPNSYYKETIDVTPEGSVFIGGNYCSITSKLPGQNWKTDYRVGDLNNRITKISFINNNTGFAIGDFGTILKTTNKGTNWVKKESNTGSHLNVIDIIDENNIFACGNGGIILKSSDGGNSWIHRGTGTAHYIYMDFKNILTGYVSYIVSSTPYQAGFKLKTTNGGLNWTPSHDSLGLKYYDIKFISNDTILIAGGQGSPAYTNGVLYKSTNAGLSWNLIKKDTLMSYNKLRIISSTEYIMTAGGPLNTSKIYKTTNAGINWTSVNFNINTIYFDFKFIDVNNYWYATDKEILHSTNGGQSWDSLSSFLSFHKYKNLQFLDNDTGFVMGDSVLLKTINGGNNWNAIYCQNGFLPGKMKMFDNNTGYSINNHFFQNNFKIFKSTTGGQNWFRLNSIDTSYAIVNAWYKNSDTVRFIGARTIPNVDTSTVIFETTNGGISFIKKVAFPNENFWGDIYFIDYNTGFFIYGKNLYKTTNAGNNWDLIYQVYHTYNYSPLQLFGVHHNKLYLSIYNKIYFSSNLGRNWDSCYMPFLPDNSPNTIIEQFFSINKNTFAINTYIQDSNYSFPSSSIPVIARTTNLGITWNYNYLPTNGELFLFDPDNAYLAGTRSLMKTTNLGITFVNNNSEIISNDIAFILNQNYPNPFNPSTKISFNIFETGIVELNVYDILGRNVKSLINQKLSSGSYEVEFLNTNLSSGIYFYTLNFNSLSEEKKFTSTKKMMLVK